MKLNLSQKGVPVSQSDYIWHIKALSLLFIKTHDILKAKNCSNIGYQSTNIINDFWDKIIESAYLINKKRYDNSIATLNEISLEFIAVAIMREGNTKYRESINYEKKN